MPTEPVVTLDDDDPRERIKWYALIAGLAVLAVAGGAVVVNTDDGLTDSAAVTLPTETTVQRASEPPVPTTVPATIPTAVPTTVAPVATTGPATSTPAAPAAPVSSLPGVTTAPVNELAPGPRVEVTDGTGSFTVLLPAGFQTNVEPITIDGIDMRQVTGATDLDGYLAGDFGVLGATVLSAPADQVTSPADLVARFDPGQGCTVTDIEHDVPTSQGDALVISYDECGGSHNALVLVSVELSRPQNAAQDAPSFIGFVGLQAPGPASAGARDLAIDILESMRQT